MLARTEQGLAAWLYVQWWITRPVSDLEGIPHIFLRTIELTPRIKGAENVNCWGLKHGTRVVISYDHLILPSVLKRSEALHWTLGLVKKQPLFPMRLLKATKPCSGRSTFSHRLFFFLPKYFCTEFLTYNFHLDSVGFKWKREKKIDVLVLVSPVGEKKMQGTPWNEGPKPMKTHFPFWFESNGIKPKPLLQNGI